MQLQILKRRLNFLLGVVLAVILGVCAATSINLTTQVRGLLPVANGGTNTATANAATVFMGPASGTGAPAFRTLSISASPGVPRPNTARWSYLIENSTGISNAGDRIAYNAGTVTHNVADANNPAYVQCQAAITLNADCRGQSNNQVSTTQAYVVGKNIYYSTYMALTVGGGTSADDERVWACLTDQSDATMTASDNPAGNYYCFRYSSATDSGKWIGVSKDNSTQSTCATNLTVDTNYHSFEFTADDSVPNVTFKIDGGNSCTITTHLPTSGTALRWVQTIRTTVGGVSAHATKNGWWYIESDQ